MQTTTTTSSVLRMGILGASWIAPMAVIEPAKKLTSIKITAIAARDKKRAQEYASKHKIPQVFDSYDALLEDKNIDCIYIGLPNSHHAVWTIKGKHVLCEKPMASNVSECNLMHAKAQECGLVLMEAFHYRYHPLMLDAMQWIKHLGTIKHVETEFCIPIFSGSDIRYNFNLAGGAMMDTGCYAVHCMRTLLQEEPTSIEHATTTLAYPNVDQTTMAQIKTSSGKTAPFTCSLFTIIPKIGFKVIGTNGTMTGTNFVLPQMLYNNLTIDSTELKQSKSYDKNKGTYDYQMEAFVAAIHGDKQAVITDSAGAIKNQQVIDSVYQHLKLPLRQGVKQ